MYALHSHNAINNVVQRSHCRWMVIPDKTILGRENPLLFFCLANCTSTTNWHCQLPHVSAYQEQADRAAKGSRARYAKPAHKNPIQILMYLSSVCRVCLKQEASQQATRLAISRRRPGGCRRAVFLYGGTKRHPMAYPAKCERGRLQ